MGTSLGDGGILQGVLHIQYEKVLPMETAQPLPPLVIAVVEERANGRDTMDEEQPQPQAEASREEAALLKLQEEFRYLVHECGDCRREIESHWQFCAHCGIRLATHCPGCGNPLPPPGAHACLRCGLALPQISP